MGYIDTIEDFKKHVIVSNDFRLDSAKTILDDVKNDYLVNLFGTALISEIETYKNNASAVKASSFNYMEKAISKFIIEKFLTKGQIMIDNGAVTRIETENSKTAYKNQIKDAKELYLDEAYTALDLLVDLMAANAGSFTNWAGAPIKANQAKLLVKTAKYFNELEALKRKNLTFQSLIPTQINCIDLYLKARFTSALIDELIANSGLNSYKSQLKTYLDKALVNFCIGTGMKKNLVYFSSDGISLVLHDEETASELKSKAELAAIENQINTFLDTGHRYMSLAEQYVRENTTEISGQDTEPFTKTNAWM